MRRLMTAIAIAALTMTSTAALAKKKKDKPAPTAQKSKDNSGKEHPPGDKSTNEGAQGRINSTEAASQAADSSQFEHRP